MASYRASKVFRCVPISSSTLRRSSQQNRSPSMVSTRLSIECFYPSHWLTSMFRMQIEGSGTSTFLFTINLQISSGTRSGWWVRKIKFYSNSHCRFVLSCICSHRLPNGNDKFHKKGIRPCRSTSLNSNPSSSLVHFPKPYLTPSASLPTPFVQCTVPSQYFGHLALRQPAFSDRATYSTHELLIMQRLAFF